jgi:hypothetical protein
VPAYTNIATLAVDRIATLELTDETFTVDPAFDPKRLETEAFGVSWENPMRVIIRFRADQAPYVREREMAPDAEAERATRWACGADVSGLAGCWKSRAGSWVGATRQR